MIVVSRRRAWIYVLAFLLPNFIGFLVFTAGPVAGSLGMSLTDLSLTKHNAFSDTPVRFVGLDNYRSILAGAESDRFWRYFSNTVYLMIGIPLGIAGSLGASLLITSRLTPRRARGRLALSGVAVAITAVAALAAWAVTWPGPPPADAAPSVEMGLSDLSAHEVQRLRSIAAVAATLGVGALAVLGLSVGSTFFRTAFYLPSLLAGVPMFLLWKALYRPDGGLINAALDPAIDAVHAAVMATPPGLWKALGAAIGLSAAAIGVRVVAAGVRKLADREAGPASFAGRLCIVGTLVAVGVGIAAVCVGLPEQARVAAGAGADGFDPPEWLVSSTWAKPALVIMGVWLGVGGANMLLYIAGISNIPPQLYEAADIDGAGPWQRFINITWPQLAPTTFFIVIMSTIAGLQGGFEQALIMTGGQYETTVLTFYIYNLAFTDEFRLGMACAVAWVMFAIIFGMTLVNYRLGSRLTNE